ncbi:hypothetical protein AVEN_72280-1 [Araneus ventricosus]|uniref:Uncharacterized protein n=1 Tax=Araneus ventricosus TaxID=182803 RepID=A0A4Y2SP60_ARAVE|nr:hypothetical protein AVEN_72280-1 [Araneus ventricosus]
MLPSHEKYLMCVMVACLYEHECNRNIFDSFISVCALVINLSFETHAKTGVNFFDLNPDIIMVFYRNVLKRSFHRRRGFYRFVEYVLGHKYLTWNRNYLILSDDPTAPNFIELVLDENIMAELNGYVPQEVSNDMKVTMEATGICLAQEVLSTTSVELPT